MTQPETSSGIPGAADAPRGVLDGLLVIDLTMMLAGPYASMMLADQGARVIKIEPPGGDQTRRSGPLLENALTIDEGGFGSYFASINRGKESLVLDLKQPAGREVLLQLVRRADVLIENYRSGVMERLGLAYETLRIENPRLVYASLRGFGDRRGGASHYGEWPAYDPVAQAMGGIMSITGPVPGGPPTKIGPGIGDIAPAMFLAFGIASACWRAQRTGQGQYVDVGMVDSILAICERMVYQFSATGKAPSPEGNGHPLLCPFGLFKAKDGYVSLGIPRDEFWQVFVRLIGQPDLATDPRYALAQHRLERRHEVDALVTEWTSARTKAEITATLGGKVPFGPVFDAKDIFDDAHFQQRAMLVEVEQPGTNRKLTIANTPVRMVDTPGGVRRRAPLTGEHSDHILSEFGYTPEQRRQMRDAGVIA